ncbi:HAD-IA family hydrolase [Sinanaerobacter chloroacetimidivorans]|uniref:HAD-IA family hydrolase n=1 Tax=Sinanaerobacter chloroacetimidivorans TaxID=2818044 RepID=A0A8J7VZH4_9FIRM|nr:HAD-IA family hydrolase [Sinanaerobacter chloroacetimidivorans]MBR0598002.1 HAD-IA family hydrolase [Sinanaerobacter chloroacetimidivorans]
MAKLNTVLFDFDGTVMDTNNVIIQSWQHTFQTVEGKERTQEEIVKTFGEPLFITMERVLPQIPVEEGVSIYRGYHYDHFSELISIFPGMLELLQELKTRNFKVGLVTSRLKQTTEIGLKKYDMEQYFDTIVTCEDCEKHKPDPEPVLIALERLGSKPEETVMLGDSMFDILCARSAGVKAALVGWALAVSEEDKAGADAPDLIIETAEELLNFLEQ